MRTILAAALAAIVSATPAAAVQLVSADANGNAITDYSDTSATGALLLDFDLVNLQTATATLQVGQDDGEQLNFSALIDNLTFQNIDRLRIELLDGATFLDTAPITSGFASIVLTQLSPSSLRLGFLGGEPFGVELGDFQNEVDQFLIGLGGLAGDSFRIAVTAEVPEPAMLGLLGLAGLGLLAARRRTA